MLKKLVFFLLIFSLSVMLFLPTNFIFARMTSDSYIIYADVFSSGGSEDSSSANYGIQDTIAEALILSATSTSVTYGIKAGFREMYPDNFLSFSIPSGEEEIELGSLTTSGPGSDSHTMLIDANAVNGFTIIVTGSTLASGANTIDAIGATAAASTPASEQFGINLVDNATPNVGANASGSAPIGLAAANYNTADSFAFSSGDTVASASSDINETTFTVSYIANISNSTGAGIYTTTLVYAATANF